MSNLSEEEKEAIYELEDIRFEERINKKVDIVLNLIDRLQKDIEIKDKVIENLYSDIEYEYSGTNYLKSLEEYYKEVEEENVKD